jgi:Skp family chaperone for outer membrane proteins
MKIKTVALTLLAAGAVSSAAVAAPAAAPAASSTPIATGPAIAGVCIVNNDYILGGSAVGKFVITRLQQLKSQVDAEINSEGTALQTDAKTLQGQRASLSNDQYEQKIGALQVRDQALQRKIQLREREMQATQEKAFGTIGQQADPIVRQVIGERTCSLVLNGAAVVVANPAMDLSPIIVQRLDAKIQQFAFDREHLDTAAAAGAH